MTPRPGQSRRLIPWSGFTFVVLFIAALILLGNLAGSFADADAQFIAYHSRQNNQIQVVIGGYLITAAGLALLIFLVALTAPSGDTSDNVLRLLPLVSGAMGVGLFLAGGAALVTSAAAKTFGSITGDDPLTGDGVAVAPQLGYVLIFLPAMWALSCAIAARTWQARTVGNWPNWLCWLSAVTAVALLLGAALFVPLMMLPVWVGTVATRELQRQQQPV